MTLLSRAYVSPYWYSIETMSVYLVPFLKYSASKNSVTLKPGVFKIIQNVAVQQTIYDFLLVRQYKYSSILYRFKRLTLR